MKLLSMVLLIVAGCICMSSCKDDDNEIISTTIVGSWTRTYEDDMNTVTETYTFNSNLTGVYNSVTTDSDGTKINDSNEYIEYSISDDSDGYDYVTIVDQTHSRRYRYEITASKLLLYTSSDVYLEFKRK